MAEITPGEQRIELQLEGVRSVMSAGFLTLGASMARIEALLGRAVAALESIAERDRPTSRTTLHGVP